MNHKRVLALRKKFKIRPLQEVKNDALDTALEKTKGDRILAARLLGIGRTSIYRHAGTRQRRKLLRRRA